MSVLPKVLSGEAQLADHRGWRTRRNLLAAVRRNGLAGAVVNEVMAALAALGVDANRDTPLASDLESPVDEILYPS